MHISAYITTKKSRTPAPCSRFTGLVPVSQNILYVSYVIRKGRYIGALDQGNGIKETAGKYVFGDRAILHQLSVPFFFHEMGVSEYSQRARYGVLWLAGNGLNLAHAQLYPRFQEDAHDAQSGFVAECLDLFGLLNHYGLYMQIYTCVSIVDSTLTAFFSRRGRQDSCISPFL